VIRVDREHQFPRQVRGDTGAVGLGVTGEVRIEELGVAVLHHLTGDRVGQARGSPADRRGDLRQRLHRDVEVSAGGVPGGQGVTEVLQRAPVPIDTTDRTVPDHRRIREPGGLHIAAGLPAGQVVRRTRQ